MENNQLLIKLSKLNNKEKLVGLIVSFSLVLVLTFFTTIQGQIDELTLSSQKEITLKEEFLEKKKQAVNLPAHKNQLIEIDKTFGELLRQLPNKSEVDTLLKDVNQAGISQGLEFEVFRPAANEKKFDFYAEQPVQIKVTGSYHKFGAFAEEVSRLSRIVNIDDVILSVTKNTGKDEKNSYDVDGGRKLTIEATVRTYRYLDANETKSSDKKKGKGKEKDKKGAK